MVKWLNFVTTKNKQDRSCLHLKKWDLNIHVICYIILAVSQLLANSLQKVDIDLRMTLYN